MQAGSNKSISRVASDVADMVKQKGILSLWRGLAPTLWRDVPFSGMQPLWKVVFPVYIVESLSNIAIYWLGYESTKKRLPKPAFSSDLMKEFSTSFLAGAVSGTVSIHEVDDRHLYSGQASSQWLASDVRLL